MYPLCLLGREFFTFPKSHKVKSILVPSSGSTGSGREVWADGFQENRKFAVNLPRTSSRAFAASARLCWWPWNADAIAGKAAARLSGHRDGLAATPSSRNSGDSFCCKVPRRKVTEADSVGVEKAKRQFRVIFTNRVFYTLHGYTALQSAVSL